MKEVRTKIIYIVDDFVAGLACEEEEASKELVQLFSRIREKVSNFTIYKTTQDSGEEEGFVWMVGQVGDYLAGITTYFSYENVP